MRLCACLAVHSAGVQMYWKRQLHPKRSCFFFLLFFFTFFLKIVKNFSCQRNAHGALTESEQKSKFNQTAQIGSSVGINRCLQQVWQTVGLEHLPHGLLCLLHCSSEDAGTPQGLSSSSMWCQTRPKRPFWLPDGWCRRTSLLESFPGSIKIRYSVAGMKSQPLEGLWYLSMVLRRTRISSCISRGWITTSLLQHPNNIA